MKNFRLLLCFLILICSYFHVNAQGNCPWNVRMNVIEATCLNNGGIEFFLLTDNGDTIAIDIENKRPVDQSINLSEIKFYYQSLTNMEDTTTYYSPNPRIFLKPGSYRVGVQAQCYNGGDGSSAYTPLSFNRTIEVTGSYMVPSVSILANIATNRWSSGNRPTIPGQSTGRIQLMITDGSMPYTLVMVNANTQDTIETRTITQHEHSGWDRGSADYMDYYTFDSLPAATYRFYFSDDCDVRDTAISLTWTVEDAQAPMLMDMHFNATSINYTNYGTIYSDSNIVNFHSLHLSEGDVMDYLYDAYAQHLQYRVCYGTADTSEWKTFPINNLNQLNDKSYNLNNTLYDTAHHMRRYCDFLGQSLTFQYRNTFPGQEDTINFYTNPIENRIEYSHIYAEDVNYTGTWYDSCTYHIPGVHRYTDYYYYYRSYCTYSLNQTPDTYPWSCVAFYTYPIHYEIVNNDDNSIIAETNLSNNEYWYLTKEQLEEHFGTISATMHVPVTIKITDAKGCEITRTEEMWIYNGTDTLDGNHYLSYDQYHYENYEAAKCCQSLKGFSVYEEFHSDNENTHDANPIPQRYKQTRDGAKFQLYRSPDENKYNFTATYHYDTDEWEIDREDISNTAVITSYLRDNSTNYRWGLLVEDFCLPYGNYYFYYITACDTQRITVYYNYDVAYQEIYVHTIPTYTSYQECDNYFITLQSGEYKKVKIGADTGDPMQPLVEMSSTSLNTYFRIIDGPQGGYPTNDFRVGRTIRLTIPGTYTLRMFTPDSSNYCPVPYYDTTITYTGGTVSFDYAYAYVCDVDSTVGFFYCHAKDGKAPYHYSLYELTNMEGHLLEENNTGSFRGLSNIHVGDMMSLEVGDACGRSYYVNITVTDLSSSRMAWFDGALRVTETCEGSEIDVFVSAVEDDFTYHWTGPNDFDVTTPRGHIVIERGSEPGDYTVEIGNTGCSQTLKDTVTLGIQPAPKVEMTYDATAVCPGQSVTLSFKPTQGTGTVTYIIGREINSIDTFYTFSGELEETATLEYTATSNTTFWVDYVKDEICTYTIPEDTVVISLRDAATACDVTVSSPQVCFGATAELTASSSTMVKPYTIRWYDNPYQQNVLKTEVIEDGMPDASFTTGRLYADSTLYVTIQDATHCETYTGTVNQWMNMDSGTTQLTCGQSIRLFDDGGSNGNYLPSKYYKHTFTSTDGNLITLSFNSFNTQLNGDVMRVYTGNEVLQDSLLALISGSNLPESLTSNGTSMTIVFVSNSAIEAEGWDALVSCSAMPAQAKIKVLEDLSVSLSISPELPARYGQSYTLTAVANGGQGSRYEFTWHIADEQFNETPLPPHELAFNTDIYNLDNLTETKYVWVVVKDKSEHPCTVEDKMSNLIQIEIADIALNLELSSTVNEICQGDIPMIVKIKNDGSQTARNVKVKLALPNGMSLTDEADSLILIPEINAQGTVYDTLFIRNEAHVSTSTSMDIRAQIWSCNQGDNNSSWHNWDWNGNPNEPDEAIYTLTIRPSLDIVNAPGLTVSSANICFGGDATIQAHSSLDYPQHFIWYADAALTQVIKDTTLENNTSIIVSNEFTNITQEGAICYVMVENNTYCPAYTTVDYRTKMQYAPTDTILMHNGSSMVGNTDHIRFFDDGGADNYYAPNQRYNYLFTSVDGSPLAIYFDESNYIYNYNNYARIEIYDGESDMTPRLARYTNSQMRSKVLVANSGKMLIKFYSDDYTERGISAHVFTTSRAMVAEADVTFKTPLAAENITTSDDRVCYGNDATLTASANIDFPQTHFWYDENLNPVDTITVTATDAQSSLSVSSVTHSTNYYVTISNNNECPVIVPVNESTPEREVRLDAIHNESTTIVVPGEIVNFYDEGGPNGNVITSHHYTHTFTTIQGTINVTFPWCISLCSNDTLYAYDGTTTNAPVIGKWGNSTCYNRTINSTGKSITFEIIGNCNAPSGWWAQITSSNPESSMALAKASVKAGVPESITTDQEVAVCFGSDAELNASSTFSTYPQYFYWYNADRTQIVHRDIVENPGESSSYSITPTSETFYYVTVTNSDNCPIDESQIPQDTNNLVKIKVTFSEPVISNNVTVNDDVVCYGQNASLTATTNDGTEKHIYWYDENFHLINDEIGTSSTFEPQVSGNTVYFVNAVETNQCGILPPSYGKFYFDASKNGGVTNLTTGEMIPFYDAGGPDENYYTPGADWTHTFVAPAGKQVTLKMNSYNTNGHLLYIYDGNTNNLRRSYNVNYGENMNEEPITSTSGRLIVRWFIDYNPNDFNYPGWEGEIGVLDAHGEMHIMNTELATAHVSLKSVDDLLSTITTTDVTVCYGDEAKLTASSTIDYPQTFYWFNSSRDTILRQYTRDSGCDTLTVTPTTEGNYYVYVTNDQNCPLPQPVHNNHRTVVMNDNGQGNESYTLSADDIINFSYTGCVNGNQGSHWEFYNFNAPEGSKIHLHFNNVQLEGNGSSHIQMNMRKANGETEYGFANIDNTISNVDYETESNHLEIDLWSNCDNMTAVGWDGYAYAVLPISTENLAAANVTFAAPSISQTLQISDAEACYGEPVTLSASNGNGTYRYVWYDESYNLIQDTIGEQSNLDVTVLGNATYYVNASATNECPVVPPHYGEFWFDASKNGGTTHLMTGEAIPFYDAGGPEANYYTPGANWTHTFMAPVGKKITLKLDYFKTNSNHYLYIYDGIPDHSPDSYQGDHGYLNRTFTSSANIMTVQWGSYTDNSFYYPGWEGMIGVLDANNTMQLAHPELTEAHVKIKLVNPNDINTNDVVVCYGDSATLTASANLSYPQYYTWYASNRITEWKDTIYSGHSELRILPTSEEQYYVTVSCDTTCPIEDNIPVNREELMMNYGGYYNITTDKVLDIYDDGGRDGNYSRTCTTEVYGFNAPSNSNIRIHFNNVDLGDNGDSYINLSYNDASTGEYKNITINGRESNWDLVAYTTQINMYVTTGCNDITYPGWDGYIYISSPKDPADLAKVDVRFAVPTFSSNVTTADVEACYGNTVTLSASNGSGVSRYAWYDENKNLLKDTIGEYGTLNVLVTNNVTYYVSASSAGECPILPPHYGEFWFDHSKNGGTTILTEGEAIPFYDEGGPNANYNTPDAYWTHTFVAPAGKQVTLKMDYYYSAGGHYLEVFDGTGTNNNLRTFNACCYYNETVTSNTGALTVRWKIEYDNNSFGYTGWIAQIGVLDNNNEMEVASQPDLTAARVTIKTPVVASQITTTDGAGCYGYSATLQASSNLSDYPQTFYWYDANYNPVDTDIVYSANDHAEYLVGNTTNTTTYYVTVGNETECPAISFNNISNNSQNIDLRQQYNGKTTVLTQNEVIFNDYDGRYEDIQTTADFTHTFTALQGKIKIKFNGCFMLCSSDSLYVFDGTDINGNLLGKWGGDDCSYPEVISSSNSITVLFKGSDCGSNGWRSVVTAINDMEDYFASATAYVRIGAPESITAQDVVICYGDDAVLEASSDIAYDQTFTWYGPDRTTVLDVQPISSGNSTYTVPQPTEEGTYYVMVTNDTTCPIPSSNYEDVYMSEDEKHYTLTPGTIVNFYDAGGPNDNYLECGKHYYYFEAEQGSTIHFHLDYIQLDDYGNAYMELYNESNWSYIAGFSGSQTNVDYEIQTSRLRVYFNNCSNPTYSGWQGTISVEGANPVDPANLKAIHVSFMDPVITDNIQVNDQEACYGETVTLSVNNYDPNMQYVWFDENYEVIGRSETIDVTVTENRTYYVNASASNECPIVTPDFDGVLTAVQVNLKAPVAPSNIATNSPVEVCYGSETTLTASTNISYPQTYTWYGPDRMVPVYEETIYAGQSNYTFAPEENVYYVSVTNSENCPPLASVHNDEMTILLDGNGSNSHTLTEHQLIHFYDAGGVNDNYNDCNGGYYYFYAPEGSRLRMHFNSVALEDNDDTYLRLYLLNESGNYEYRYIYGNVSDTDFVAPLGSYIEVYFYNSCNSETAPGWDAYIYAMKPISTDELASVRVNFSEPIFSQNVSTNDVEACYGEPVTLTATNGNGTSNYAWYDENMNFLGSNQTGTIDVTAYNNSTYYVNASAANECPVLPPHYGEFWFDASQNGGITNLTQGAAIPFYDEAGPDANYSTSNADWTHTFVAPAGKRITVKLDYFRSECGHRLEFYNGTTSDDAYINHNPFDSRHCGWYGNETFTSSSNVLTIRWYIDYNIYSLGQHNGWSGQIGVLGANNEMQVVTHPNLAAANVTIKAPIDPSEITTTGGEGCHGATVTLQASSSQNVYPQIFYWYDNNLNFVGADTVDNANDHAEYTVPGISGTTTYYVTMGNGVECPVVVEDNQIVGNNQSGSSVNMILLNDNTNNGTSTIDEQSVYAFYDEGGLDNDYYSTEVYWTHTFSADNNGQIRLHFNEFGSEECCDYLQVYDGTSTNGNNLGELRGYQSNLNFESTTGSLTVYWHTDGGSSKFGWDAYVSQAVNQVPMASATANLKAPLGPNEITTTNGEACYGQSATLTAKTAIAGSSYPQYYTWYNEALTAVHFDTLYNDNEVSSYTVPQVTGHDDYYVTMSNADNCSVVFTKEILLNEGANGGTTIMDGQNNYRFCDEGGSAGYYHYNNSWSGSRTHTFTNPSGQVYVTFDRDMDFYDNDRLYIYDGTSENDVLIHTITRDVISSMPLTFQSSTNSLTFKFDHYSWSENKGWSALVATSPIAPNQREIKLNRNMNNQTTIVNSGEVVNFYDEGGTNNYFYLDGSNNSSITHTFTAASGKLQIAFKNYVNMDGIRMLIYDGTEVNSDNLITEYSSYNSWNSENTPIFTSTSSSITIKLQTDYSWNIGAEGWRAEITTTIPDLAIATASAKVVNPSSIVAFNDTICYGSEATLTASSEIGVPQYYFWYGPDRMSVLKYDTVTVEGGHSSLTVLTGMEESYYVTVTNDTTCPFVEPIHNNVRNVVVAENFQTSSIYVELASNDSVVFYDAGGPDGNIDFRNNNNGSCWDQSVYFTAENGSYIHVHLDYLDGGSSDARFTIYDEENGREIAYFRTSAIDKDYEIKSTRVRLSFSNDCDRKSFRGWLGSVYTVSPRDVNELAEARVRFKEPVGPGTITTENPFEVCYGSEVTLTASSTLDADQYFVWYAEDRVNILKRDTVHTAGQNSMLTVTPDEDHTTYYVAVTNAANCPIIENIHTHYREVLIGQSYQLQPYDSIGFFDDGGRNNNYAVNSSSRSSYFTAEDGSHIRIHIDTINLARRAQLRITDEENNQVIANFNGPLDTANLDFVVESNRIYCYFDNDKSSLTAMGWNAYIYAITPHNEDDLVEVNVEFMDPTIADQNDVTVTEVEACYGETVTLTASVETIEPQRFVWYDEESNVVKDEVSTGSNSLTVVATEEAFYYVNVSSPEDCPVLSPYEGIDGYALPYGHIIIKKGVAATEIATVDDEVCFGAEATLTANSTIDFPQYYTWFAPDRITILKQETVNAGGHSTLTITPEEEADYYVAVSNDDNCPIVEQIHNHYVEILMDGSRYEYELAANDSVGFFDAGGKTGDYLTGWSGDFNFRADQGSFIRIHFDTVQLARNAYIQIYEGDNYNSSVAYITGSRGNLDTIIENNRVRIYFYGYSNSSAPGWEAYVYALNPRDEDELASAHVSFMQPSINNNLITTTNAEGCYSATDTVKAVSTLTENQYFAWYDNEMNLLKQEVIPSGEYSELPVEILANTTYYVNVSTENECPVLPPHYGEFWFNASVNGGTTNLAEGEGVPFYDEAGPDGIYNTPDADWTHTFVAPAGKQVTLLINDYYTSCGHQLEIYDGTTTSNQLRSYSCCCYSNETITSNTGALTIRWRVWDNSFDYRGWDGLIGVVDDHGSMSTNSFDMAEATVTVTSPTWNLPLTTTNDTVCYGDAAYLTATSTIDYPQHYVWFAPDARTILLRDTVDGIIKTESVLDAPYYYHYQDQTYYVAIGNEANCPPVLAQETTPRTVLLNADAHNQTTVLAENESAKFYDAGGLNESYHDHNSDYTHTFQAVHGTLMVQFKDNNMDIYRYDTLYVYDSDHADETRLLGKVINDWDDDLDQRVMNYEGLKYYSTGQYMTFRFQQGNNNNWYSGWNATVMPYNLESELATAEVNVKISSVPEMAVTTMSDTVCYGSAATVSASADLQYPQYYIWYNDQMEVLKQDTLVAGETESVLSLPPHYNNETYYAYVYSDTVSCLMNMDAMPKQYSELYLNTNMDGGITTVHPYDSIGFFSDGVLQGSNNRSLDMDYYFTAENGLIRIHFDEVELTYETWMEFQDDGYDIEFMELEENTYYDVTITSLSNTLHIDFGSKSSDRATAYWRGTVTNVNVVNSAVLSKMAQANVAVEINNSVNTVTTTNDTVCIGSPAMLTASSDIAYPQYYTWYNDDLSSILFEDTIASGSSNFYIPGQVGNATYRAMVSNDTTCTLRPVQVHNNFKEFVFDANMSGHTIFVGAIDSVVIYDDGGKDGNYTVPEDERILILKVETYPGATLNFRVPMAQLYEADDDLELVIVEPDENGNIGEGSIGMMLMGSINDEISYSTTGNEAFVAWVMYGTDLLPMPGFEMVVTADLHPEQHLAEAQVIMKSNLPMDYNALTNTTSTVICQGDNAELEATSNLTENPQYFLWYSNDLSRVIGADTVYSGSVSHVSIPNLMQDTLLYVAVGTDEVCPAYPMEHKLISEIKLNTLTNAHTTYLSAVDSVLFYDDGGKNNRYTFQNGYLYRTFKASSGHVVFNLHELSITDCDDENFLGVLDGEFDIQNVDEDSIRAMYYAEEIPAGDSIIISTGNTLSIIFVSDHMHEDEPNNGWFASIYTTEQVNSDMSVLTPAEVTVNPTYQFDVYDTTNASHTPYTTPDNMFRDIDVTAEGEYVIDSVYQTALNCDSTYTLHLTVLPPTVQDIIIASHSNSWTYDGWIHTEQVYTVVYGLDTLTADAGSDGKVFTMPGTGDLLTITPDADAEVVYYTPTPVPNSFSYVLENEGEYPSVTTDTGTLEIVPIATEIVITANSASKYYDGTPLTNDGFTYTPADILVEGDTLVVEIVGTITEIGDSLNRVVSYQVLRNVNFNRRGLASYTQDVTNCYTFALPVSGTLSIVDTFTVSCVVTDGGRICPGSNDGTATITIEGGKYVSPDRYEYSIVGDNTGYNNTGHSEGEINLTSLNPDNYTVTATDALGLTATATFSIVERPLITSATVFDCPDNIDTVLKHGGCNLMLLDIGTPNFVAPTGMDMADVTIYNNAPADHIYEVGETTVTWVAKGMCGDSVTCDQIIKVSFQTCPAARDYEDTLYPSVRLGRGCKCWTTKNLVSTKYSDGRDIDDVMDYYSYEYPNAASNVAIFGHLYNWYAAADTARYGSVDSVERAYTSGNHIQGICPDGWYLPSDEEYDELNIYPTTDLRSTEYWIRVNGLVNTNLTGFNSLPGGMYNCASGRFESLMGESHYWTCHPVYDMASGAMIDYICEKILTHNNSRCNGYSIRCIWDEH